MLIKWEYREVAITHGAMRDGSSADILKVYGEIGWEFTGFVRDTDKGKAFMMKRNMEWLDRGYLGGTAGKPDRMPT